MEIHVATSRASLIVAWLLAIFMLLFAFFCSCWVYYRLYVFQMATGYPYNLDLDYGALSQLQHFSINNLGDPFIESNYGVHSKQLRGRCVGLVRKVVGAGLRWILGLHHQLWHGRQPSCYPRRVSVHVLHSICLLTPIDFAFLDL